ncbi:MAG: hypothetical protein ABW189_08170 [Rickettsiales bacterium]
MPFKTPSLLVAASLFAGSASLAETPLRSVTENTPIQVGIEGNVAVKDLPKSGPVTLTGTVDSVDGATSFTLRDADGNTIDVKTNADVTLQKGDFVKVQGTLDDEISETGREITFASVTRLGSHSVGTPKIGDDARAFAGKRPASRIAELPYNGPVLIAGTVESVKDGETFLLRDSAGITIDVKTPAKLNVSQGENVVVQGSIQYSLTGTDREIVADAVTKSDR